MEDKYCSPIGVASKFFELRPDPKNILALNSTLSKLSSTSIINQVTVHASETLKLVKCCLPLLVLLTLIKPHQQHTK